MIFAPAPVEFSELPFSYSDGTDSRALQTGLEWKPEAGGNQRTFEFLKTLEYSNDETISVSGVLLGATYAGFSRGTVTDNEGMHPGLGYTMPYQSERRDQATIYVYNKGRRDLQTVRCRRP